MRRAAVVIGGVLGIALLMGACSDPSSTTTDPGPFFPTAGDEGGVTMAALFEGPLVVKNDCVLAGHPGDYTLPVWRDGYTAGRDGSGKVIVRDGDGATIAIEGETFQMGGGYIAEFRPANKVDPVDEQLKGVAEMVGTSIPERCLGPEVYGVWWVGDTEPLGV